MLLLSSNVIAQQVYCTNYPNGNTICVDGRTGQQIIYRRGL